MVCDRYFCNRLESNDKSLHSIKIPTRDSRGRPISRRWGKRSNERGLQRQRNSALRGFLLLFLLLAGLQFRLLFIGQHSRQGLAGCLSQRYPEQPASAASRQFLWVRCPSCGVERWAHFRPLNPSGIRRCTDCAVATNSAGFKVGRAEREG